MEVFIIRIAFALLFGIFIGFERQLTGHLGGIKTNSLICFGACLFTIFSFIVDVEDTTRIAAQVVSGVGFICSGVIFKDKAKESVSGLSTSATIWSSAAIGVVTATGEILFAFIATILLIAANLIVSQIAKIKPLASFDDSEKFYEIKIVCNSENKKIVKESLISKIDTDELKLTNLETNKKEDNEVEISATLLHIGRRCDNLVENIVSNILLEQDVSAGWEIL